MFQGSIFRHFDDDPANLNVTERMFCIVGKQRHLVNKVTSEQIFR
jgi:hypothetical protein